MLNRTREIISKFLFNTQVKFEYPITAISTPTKSLIAFIDLEKIGENAENFKNPFGIIKTDVLLRIIDKIPNSDVKFEETDIVISNDRITQKIRKSPANIFLNVKKEAIDMIETSFHCNNEIDLSSEDLKDILDRAKLLGHDTLIIKKDLIITGRENGTELEDEAQTKIETKSDGEVKLSIANLNAVPTIDYKIKIFTNGDIRAVLMYPVDYPEVKVAVTEKLD